MEAEKLNNGDRKSGSCEAGLFIAGLVGQFTKSGY